MLGPTCLILHLCGYHVMKLLKNNKSFNLDSNSNRKEEILGFEGRWIFPQLRRSITHGHSPCLSLLVTEVKDTRHVEEQLDEIMEDKQHHAQTVQTANTNKINETFFNSDRTYKVKGCMLFIQ